MPLLKIFNWTVALQNSEMPKSDFLSILLYNKIIAVVTLPPISARILMDTLHFVRISVFGVIIQLNWTCTAKTGRKSAYCILLCLAQLSERAHLLTPLEIMVLLCTLSNWYFWYKSLGFALKRGLINNQVSPSGIILMQYYSTPQKSGFKGSHSTETALPTEIGTLLYVIETMRLNDKRCPVITSHLARPVGSLSHGEPQQILPSTLPELGISGEALLWFKSYLTEW